MNTLIAVHQLGNVHVAGDAGQHVSVVARHVLGADEEINHLAHRNPRGFMQLRMKAHADVMRGRFSARIFLSSAFVHDELKRPDQRSFKGGDVHFAIALAGVSVADLKQRAAGMHRQEECCPGDEFLVIHIAGVQAGRRTVDAAKAFRRRHSHAAKKRMQRDFNARRELGDHALFIERDDLHFAIRKVFRQKTARGPKSVVGIRNGQIDFLDADFEGVTGLGFFYIDRPIQDVSSGTFIGYFFVNIAQALFHLVGRDASFFQASGTVGDQRIELHGVTGVNAQDRRRGGIVITPGNGLGSGGQLEMLR